MTDEALTALLQERDSLLPLLLYPTMEGHERARARKAELDGLIHAEEVRRASLTGFNLVERQLEQAQRTAAASEKAAQWAKWAAVFTAVAAVATLLQSLRK